MAASWTDAEPSTAGRPRSAHDTRQRDRGRPGSPPAGRRRGRRRDVELARAPRGRPGARGAPRLGGEAARGADRRDRDPHDGPPRARGVDGRPAPCARRRPDPLGCRREPSLDRRDRRPRRRRSRRGLRRQRQRERDGDEPDGRVGGRVLRRRHRLDERAADHHAAVLGHVEPLGGRASVGSRRRQERDTDPDRRPRRASGRRTRTRVRRSRARIDTLSTTLDTETSTIEDTADGVSSIADVPSAITKISTSLSALGTAFSQTLQTIEDADASGELQSALQDSPDCADITSSG